MGQATSLGTVYETISDDWSSAHGVGNFNLYTLQEQHQSLHKNNTIRIFCSNLSMGVYEHFYVGKHILKHK